MQINEDKISPVIIDLSTAKTKQSFWMGRQQGSRSNVWWRSYPGRN